VLTPPIHGSLCLVFAEARLDAPLEMLNVKPKMLSHSQTHDSAASALAVRSDDWYILDEVSVWKHRNWPSYPAIICNEPCMKSACETLSATSDDLFQYSSFPNYHPHTGREDLDNGS